MIHLLLSSLLFLQQSATDLTPASKVERDAFNTEYLSELVEKKINEVRAANEAQELRANEVLFKAAVDHAEYMAENQTLTHEQPEPTKAKVKQRVKHYNGMMRGVGENVAQISAFKYARYKNREGNDFEKTLETYDEFAEAIICAWLASPPHKGNMIYPKFEFGEVSIAFDAENNSVYVAHVMAYDFIED
jgi:uncharacterized protein YkwD